MFSSRNEWVIPLAIALLVSGGIYVLAILVRPSINQEALLSDYFVYTAVVVAFGVIATAVYVWRRRSGRMTSSGH